jgi:type IV secretion system protein VirB11
MHSAPTEKSPEYGRVIQLARDAMVRELMRPFVVFLAVDGVTEIIVNRPGEVFLEIGPAWEKHSVPELTFDRLMGLATTIASFTEQEIGPHKPIMSAMLPDGERVQIVVPPAVEQETISFSIRKPAKTIISLEQFEREGTFGRYVWAKSRSMAERSGDLEKEDRKLVKFLEENRLIDFFRSAILEKKTIAVVGDTGSGKTTLMKAMCQVIPRSERLTTIEDVRELLLPEHANRVHLLYSKGGQGVAQVTPADLIAANMRMKPDRVLLAELRGGEAFDFLKLLTTGHRGSITSYHAESCALAAERFVFMAKEHPQAAIYDAASLKQLVALTIDIIVHIVARNVYDDAGDPVRRERYVAEIHFDPIAKLRARFGDAIIHHA